jgi:hypothetical protein
VRNEQHCSVQRWLKYLHVYCTVRLSGLAGATHRTTCAPPWFNSRLNSTMMCRHIKTFVQRYQCCSSGCLTPLAPLDMPQLRYSVSSLLHDFHMVRLIHSKTTSILSSLVSMTCCTLSIFVLVAQCMRQMEKRENSANCGIPRALDEGNPGLPQSRLKLSATSHV